jgi:DNA-binding GntR family transcriptional regulator
MKYQEIEKFIIKNIETGGFKADEMILSENQLAAKFDTSRMTARRAINNLVSKNLLYQRMGKGTFVVDNSQKMEIYLGKTIDFAERTAKAGKQPRTRSLKFEIESAELNVSSKLNIGLGEKVYCIERLRFIDAEPAVFEITYIPYDLYRDLDEGEIEILKFEYVKRLDERKTVRQLKEFTAVLPEIKTQNALSIGERTPVLQLEVISFLESDIICEYSRVYYNQSRFKFLQSIEL